MTLRKIPYPYRAMLAICSDLDETPDSRCYFEIMRFLNTDRNTVMGKGVGLETGNTIYFDMPPDQFSYWNTDEPGREALRTLIQSGHIDCLHSFGDLARTRAHAGRALEEMERHGCRLEVWVDHAVAPTNFGSDIMHGKGDLPGAEAYHADLSWDYGIRYVWRGRITSVTGQETKRRLSGIFRPAQPIASGRTLAKEFAKGVFGKIEGNKYNLHPPNRVLRSSSLRDGRPVAEFLRMNPFEGGVNLSATAEGLAEVVTERMLDRLVDREGISILYTHLGKIRDPHRPFGEKTVAAFRLLAKYQAEGKILVTTTRRLLGYCALVSGLRIQKEAGGSDCYELHPDSNLQDARLDGLCLYTTEDIASPRIAWSGNVINSFVSNPPDHTGRISLSVPWNKMDFPELSS